MTGLADYEAWKAKQQQAGVGAATVVLGSVEQGPDQIAGDLNLANEYGKVTGMPVPPAPMVGEYRSVFQAAIEKKRAETILSSSPRLTEWLRNPENAGVARDDLEGLSWWETTFGAGANAVKRGAMRAGPQAANQYFANVYAGRAADADRSFGEILFDERTPIVNAQGQEVDRVWPGVSEIAGSAWRYAASRLTPEIGGSLEQNAAAFQRKAGQVAKRIEQIPMSPGGEAGKARFMEAAKADGWQAQLQGIAQAFVDAPGEMTSFVMQTAAESLPSLAVAAGVGAVTRNPTAAASVMGGTSFATEYGSAPVEFFKEKGLDVSTPEGAMSAIRNPELMREAEQRGITRGVIIGALDGLSGGIAGTKLAESALGNMVLQSLTQAVLGAGGEAGAQVASGQRFNLAEVVLEGIAEFATAPVEVGSMAVSRMREVQAQARDAEARVGLFQELSGQAVNSKLRARMPDRFRQFVEQATANGPVENVFVPAQDFVKYFQDAGIDPFELVNELDGVTRDDLDAALAGGGDLKIPTATYAAKIAGSEHDAFLMENMRFDPMEMTAREAAEFNARVDEVMQEMWAEAEDIRNENERWRAEEAKIYDEMVSKLRIAGRSTEVATTEAMIWPAFYRVMAERSGMATDEFLARYPLPQVQGAIPMGMQSKNVDELTRTLAELRTRKAPKENQSPLLDFIAKRGGVDDIGGELRARNADGQRRPGQGRIARRLTEDGKPMPLTAAERAEGRRFGMDDVAQAAVEAGFFADNPTVIEWKAAQQFGDRVAPDLVPVLLEEIDRELAGQGGEVDQNTADLDAMEEWLAQIGVSLDQSDEEIRAAIEAAQGDDARMYAQGKIATESEAFKKWFGDSKVVDADGKPLVVYHGTKGDVEAFDASRFGQNDSGWYGRGVYVSADKMMAEAYAGWDEMSGAAPEGGNVMPVYVSLQNPYYFTSDKTIATDTEGSRALTERLKAEGYDGVIVQNSYADGVEGQFFEVVAFSPTQIKSVFNRGTWDGNDARILFQEAQASDEPLYVVHNLSAEKLRKAAEIGGLAAPSLAVARGDIGFDSFGEISLIGDPSLANPKTKGVRLFNADVYSPRQPRARFKVDAKAARAMNSVIGPVAEKLGLPFYEIRSEEIERDGLSAIGGQIAAKAAWLESVGVDVPVVREVPEEPAPVNGMGMITGTDADALVSDPAFLARVQRKYELALSRYDGNDAMIAKINAAWLDEAGNISAKMIRNWADQVAKANRDIEAFRAGTQPEGPVSRYLTGKAIDEAVGDRIGEFNGWVREKFGSVITDTFFENEAGRKKEYTLSNLVREMTRTIRNGENWNYGAGNVRAAVAPEFKSLSDVKAARGQIVDERSMEALKDEVNDELMSLADRFAPYAGTEGQQFGWGDTFSEFLRDVAKGPRAVAEWPWAGSVPPEVMDEAVAFLEKLKGLPTNYFEIKMQRAMGFGEFTAALVPSNLPDDAREILTSAGLELVEYQKDDDGAGRKAALQQIGERVFFQRDQSPRGLIQIGDGGVASGETMIRLFEQANLSTMLHESGHFFLLVMQDLAARGEGQAVAEYEAVKTWWRDNAKAVAADANKARGKRVGALEQAGNPAFDAWFGDSKVVDADGKPLVVYHGGSFDENRDGAFATGRQFGFFFSPNKKLAQSYAPGAGIDVPVTAAYLRLENPFNPKDPDHVYAPWVKEWIDYWRESEGWIDRRTGEDMSDDDVFLMIEDVRLWDYEENGVGVSERWDDFLRTAQDHHDGFYGYDPTDGGVISVAFSPEQIKSVNNRGTFDPADPRILYQGVDLADAADANKARGNPAFKKWFGASKAVDANGKPLVVYHGTNKDFEAFSPEKLGEATGAASSKMGFFFASDPEVASSYADAFNYYTDTTVGRILQKLTAGKYEKIEEGLRRALGRPSMNASGGNVVPVYLSIQNPMVYDFKGAEYRDRTYADLIASAKATGHDGVIFRNTVDEGFNEGGDAVTDVFVAFSPEQIKSTFNNGEFNPNDPRILYQDGDFTDGDLTVTADDVIRAIDTGTTGDSVKDMLIDVGMQEQWARAFEAYLMEGKAPSIELRGAFEKFRAWLVSVYRKIVGLNVPISDDIRAVFDRMLASDAEIEKAQRTAGGGGNVFATAEEMGLTEEEYQRFLKLRSQAEDEAKARLMGEIMEPIKREREKWFKDEKAKVAEEVERNINASPVYRAWEWMGNRRWLGEGQPANMPDMRMSKDILVQRYGEGVLSTLPRGKHTLYAVDGGADPDDVAGWFGFDSGDQMIRALERAPGRKDAIKAETDRVMNERHGDALNDGEIEQIALDAVHSDKKGQWIAAELKAVAEVAGVDLKLTAKDARATARQTIARMKVRDAMAANRFLAAERKASEEAARLGAMLAREGVWMQNARRRIASKARAGQVDATARQIEQANASTLKRNETVQKLIDAKRRQLMNHALYMEARDLAAEVGKAERYIQRLNKASTREKIAGAGRRENAQIDYLNAIDEIVERYDFRKISGRAEDRRGALLNFVEAMKAAGRENELAIPEAVLRDAARKPYKTLSVDELRGVVDSLKNLEHVALRWNTLIDAKDERIRQDVIDGITAAFDANMPKRPPGRVATTGEGMRNSVRQFLDLVLNAGTILREIDGFADMGAAYRGLKAPIDAAMDRLTVRKQKAAADLEALYAVYTKDERRRMAVREHIPALGYALSKWERIAVALNTGNEGNMQRLTDPKVRGSLTPAQVKAVLATLDARDADFIQSVWDYVGSFRDDIAARERRTTGVEPKWVDASPVDIAGKTLKGGYYPLKYDPRLSTLARDDEAQSVSEALQAGRFGKAQTKRGHLEARAKSSGRDVELDMSVLHRHVNQVIYDLELSEPVANSWKVLQSGEVRQSFMDAGRQADFDALETWLKDVAEGQLAAGDWVNRNARRFKSNFTAAKLAFNLGTVMAQVTGLSQTMVVVGKKDFLRGLQASFRLGAGAEIAQKSAFMRERQTTFNKDISDFYNDPKLGPYASRWGDIKREWIGPASFWLMTKVQWTLVDIPTWLAGYHQGLRKYGNDEAKAVAHADAIVKRAQASGLFSDRSAIERGSLSRTTRQNDVVRLFTTLASYMFAKFNVAYERSVVAGRTIRQEGVSVKSAIEAASWTLDVAFLFTLEAVVMAAIKGKLPDDEEDESWAKFLAKETAMSVLGTIPFVRDVASVTSGFEGGGAYGGITAELAKPIQEIGQGEIDKGFVKSVISGTGLFTGLPATQINRAVDAGWRASEGDDVSPLEYLLGKRGK